MATRANGSSRPKACIQTRNQRGRTTKRFAHSFRALDRRLGLLAAEIGVADSLVAPQRRRVAAEREAPGLQDVAPVRDLKSHVRVLLDEQNRRSALMDLGDDAEHRLHYDG